VFVSLVFVNIEEGRERRQGRGRCPSLQLC